MGEQLGRRNKNAAEVRNASLAISPSHALPGGLCTIRTERCRRSRCVRCVRRFHFLHSSTTPAGLQSRAAVVRTVTVSILAKCFY